MIDLGNVVTPKGTRVLLHFEEGSEPEWLGAQYYQAELGERLSTIVDRNKSGEWDAGEGTVVHMLMNKKSKIVDVLSEDQFAEWQKDPKWKFGPPRLDLSNLASSRGTKIVVHFEDEDSQDDLAEEYTLESFTAKVNRDIVLVAFGRYDLGEGDTVHLLINRQGEGKFYTEAEFARWQENPSWFRPESLRRSLVRDLILANLNGDRGEFGAPTTEQLEKYRHNPVARAVSDADTDCALCLSVNCQIRHGSFNEAAFQKAIAEYKG